MLTILFRWKEQLFFIWDKINCKKGSGGGNHHLMNKSRSCFFLFCFKGSKKKKKNSTSLYLKFKNLVCKTKPIVY